MNYTKGPWVVTPCEKQFVISNKDGWYDLAVVRNISDAFDNAANARLISAAPELYEALKDVHKIICEGAKEGFDRMAGDWADRLFASNAKTHKALSKAEGVTDEE